MQYMERAMNDRETMLRDTARHVRESMQTDLRDIATTTQGARPMYITWLKGRASAYIALNALQQFMPMNELEAHAAKLEKLLEGAKNA